MNTPRKTVQLGQLFTQADLDKALAIWRTDQAHFHARCRDEVVIPALPRMKEATGQENDADYMAYLLEAVFTKGK